MSYNTVIKFIQFVVKLNPISRLKISLLIKLHTILYHFFSFQLLFPSLFLISPHYSKGNVLNSERH